MKKKILCIFFAALFIVFTFPLGIFAEETAEEQEVDLTATKSIDYDFKYVFGMRFKVEDFKEDKSQTDIYYITSIEGKKDGEKDFYLYLYNPSRINIQKVSQGNTVTFTHYRSENGKILDEDVEFENDYKKVKLELINVHDDTLSSSDATNALILKYKIDLPVTYDDNIERNYCIGDIELAHFGGSVTNYGLNKRFKIYNTNVEGMKFVNCVEIDLNWFEFPAFHTFYRVGAEGLDKFTDIQSVYFPISNELLKKYNDLYALKCIWDVCSLNNGVAINNEAIVSEFEEWIYGSKPYHKDFKYSLAYNLKNSYDDYKHFEYMYNPDSMSEFSKSKIYNWFAGNVLMNESWFEIEFSNDDKNVYIENYLFTAPSSESYKFKENLFEDLEIELLSYDNELSLVFYSDNIDDIDKASIYGNELIEYLNNHSEDNAKWDSSICINVENKEAEFTIYDKTVTIKSYDEKLSSFWDLQKLVEKESSSYSFNSFMEIDNEDLNELTCKEFANKYYVHEDDVKCRLSKKCGECIDCRINSDEYKDCTWFLLRYDTTTFQSYNAMLINNESGEGGVAEAFVFNNQAINNFDIIKVLFNKDPNGPHPCFLSGRSPSQFASHVLPPSTKPGYTEDNGPDRFQQFLEMLEKFLKWIVVILAISVVFKIVLPLIPTTVKHKHYTPRRK